MTVAIIRDNRFREHDPGAGHPESPDRLRVIDDLIERDYGILPLIPPRLATRSELALIHDPHYIQTVANTEGKPSSHLDADTGLSARSYEIARLAVGGLLEAVDRIQTPNSELRTPNSIFAFVRPPGHHAEPGRGMGFCLFNNVAIAAEYAKKKHGLKRILIVDWDLHHGNGTQKAFYEDPGVLFFSSHQYPYYPGTGNFSETGSGPGEGFIVNAPLPTGFGDAEYISIYDRILKPIALEYRPELVLVSAGFDPYFKDPLGGMKITRAGFGALMDIVKTIAEDTCSGKVLLTLEGGYSPDGLRDGVGAVLQSLMGKPRLPGDIHASPAAEQVIRQITVVQKKFWKSLR
jgi:acetoin utilization deacetylase AcuC-like enzyme